ncbi:TPA: hypothetical protein O5U36_002912, partial [Staphylococcus aureus]|nr:hypothetical protein [Staphylococcus aureus]
MSTPPVSDDLLRETVELYEANDRNQTRAASAAGLSRAALQSRLRQASARGIVAGINPMETDDLIFPDLP